MFMDMASNVQKFVFLVQTAILAATSANTDSLMTDSLAAVVTVEAVSIAMTIAPEKLPSDPIGLSVKAAELALWVLSGRGKNKKLPRPSFL